MGACSDDGPAKPFLTKEGIPTPTRSYANDFTGKMLDSSQVQALNAKLKQYEDSTTNEIAVICLPKLPQDASGSTYSIEDLATKTFRAWGIGQKDTNNGVLFLIALEDRKYRIEPGYGLEGKLTDIACKHILSDIESLFKDKKYYEGIDQAVSDMQSAIAGEYLQNYEKKKEIKEFWIWIAIIIFVCSVVGAILSASLGGGLGALAGGIYFSHHEYELTVVISAVIICGIIALLGSWIIRFTLSGSDSGGIGFSDSSGGGSSGGDSWGGGSSGGGGASGDW